MLTSHIPEEHTEQKAEKVSSQFLTAISMVEKAKNDMNLLVDLNLELSNNYGIDFSRLRCRNDTIFVFVQHGFSSIAAMMEALFDFGIPRDHVFMTTKPHTTSDIMLRYFMSDKFSNYVPFQWNDKERATYTEKMQLTIEKLLNNIASYLSGESGRAIKKLIICDEGGRFIEYFSEILNAIKIYKDLLDKGGRIPNDHPYVRYQHMYDMQVVAIEHTKSGYKNNKTLNTRPFSCINFSGSYFKTKIEPIFIINSMFMFIQSQINHLLQTPDIVIGVIGLGNLGKEMIRQLLAEYPHLRQRHGSIQSYDELDSVSYSSNIASGPTVVRQRDIQEVFNCATIILGCSGEDTTKKIDLSKASKNKHTYFISCSSGDLEFRTLLNRLGIKFEKSEDIKNYTYQQESGFDIVVYNAGFPINFQRNEINSDIAFFMQLTRVMKIIANIQALRFLVLLPHIMRCCPPDVKEMFTGGYIKLDIDAQKKYSVLFLSILCEKIPNDTCYQTMLSFASYENIFKFSSGINMPTAEELLEEEERNWQGYSSIIASQKSSADFCEEHKVDAASLSKDIVISGDNNTTVFSHRDATLNNINYSLGSMSTNLTPEVFYEIGDSFSMLMFMLSSKRAEEEREPKLIHMRLSTLLRSIGYNNTLQDIKTLKQDPSAFSFQMQELEILYPEYYRYYTLGKHVCAYAFLRLSSNFLDFGRDDLTIEQQKQVALSECQSNLVMSPLSKLEMSPFRF